MSIICLAGGLLGTNTCIVPLEDKRCFVIDPSVKADIVAKRIADEGWDLAFIVLTHGHYDHLDSLIPLKKIYPQARILIHELDSWALGKGSLEKHKNLLHESGIDEMYAELTEEGIFTDLPEADAYLSEGDVFEKDWKILHTPGHSPGSICLYSETQKTLICGDTLFYMGWGRTDFYNGDENAIMRSLKRLCLLPSDTMVFPGHGRYGFTLSQNPIC